MAESIEEGQEVSVDDANVGERVVNDGVEQCDDSGCVDLDADDRRQRFPAGEFDGRLAVSEPDVEHDGHLMAEDLGQVELRPVHGEAELTDPSIELGLSLRGETPSTDLERGGRAPYDPRRPDGVAAHPDEPIGGGATAIGDRPELRFRAGGIGP